MNRFGHIDLRVSDMSAALPFYAAVLPALGFGHEYHGEAWKVWAAEGTLPSAAYFAITEDRAHVANENRIAFWAHSRDEVDRLAAIARNAGAHIESGPRECPEYDPSYYAFFFRDPGGNRLEVVFRTA
jgi:catechol 2,3-dioxygenase-like lactoylglutathione lyase family enzyme